MNKYQEALETLEYLAVQHENTKVGKQWDEIAKEIQSCKKILQELIDKDTSKWIPVTERLPDEYDSIFAKFKGTDIWTSGMFEKISDDVNVTIEYADGTKKTETMHTVDGSWKLPEYRKCKVIAWMTLPEPYREG